MAIGRFAPCPHCHRSLSYLEGVSGATNQPKCPSCKQVVPVPRATLLMIDTSRPATLPPKVPVRA
jgi:hypothetical protein